MLIEYWRDLPQTVDKIDDKYWLKIFNKITTSSYIDMKVDISPDDMLEDLKISFEDGKINKQNIPMMMIYKFAYTLSFIKTKDIDEYMTKLYYAAQKKGELYGGFGKLY
jgi:hypothetical protein